MDPKIVANVGKRSGDYEILKKIEEETGIKVKVFQDLCGPRIRVGVLPEEIHMSEGQEYAFSFDKCEASDKTCVPSDNNDLTDDLELGHPFYLVNGAIELTITKIAKGKIYATVERGGVLSSRKGINLPKTNLSGGGLTPKDEIDAAFGASEGVDYMGLSFVQSEQDIIKLRKIIGPDIKIIAKIERGTAMDSIDKIIRESDGIMIARGDLGIEMPLEELPILQNELIRHAHWHRKSAMVATQIMLSMVEKPHPTYAEVTDVANAVFDGADTLMLSDETSVGKFT